MDNRLLKRYVSLEKRRRRLEAELRTLKVSLEDLQEPVLVSMNKANMSSLHLNGLTVYIERKIWLRIPQGGQLAAVAALKSAGMTEYVEEKFNSNSISAYLREAESNHELSFSTCERLADLEPQGMVLPEELAELKHSLGVSEVFKVKARLS